MIKNGAIFAVIETRDQERAGLKQLVELDRKRARLRDQVWLGERVEVDRDFFACRYEGGAPEEVI